MPCAVRDKVRTTGQSLGDEMISLESLRRALLRWDRLLSVIVISLPFTLMAVLGFLWLIEHGWLVWFVMISLGLGLVLSGVRWWAWRRAKRKGGNAPAPGTLAVQADPDWLPHEQRIFADVCQHIAGLTAEPQSWESLCDHAFDVINLVARQMGGERSALDFSMPEALLLLERTTSRYRILLRREVPFSDQVSISTLYWLWRNRRRMSRVVKLADGGRRILRMALNPVRGVLLEIEQIVASGNSSFLSTQMLGTLQALLLEEVAFAAVELYSGRLRFSDSELLEIQLAAAAGDRNRLARPDEPLRVLVVGQISAGKSTLLNALLEADQAETDVAPTTAGLITYQAEVGGVECHFIDTPGLDGSSGNRRSICEEMVQSDIILWVIRADRPAREVDLKLKQDFDLWFTRNPHRRKPVVIAVATGMDRLSDTWPYPEHDLPGVLLGRFAEVVNAISRDLDGLKPRPVSCISPPWNLEAVSSALEACIGEALMVQRNRRRAEASGAGAGLLAEAARGGRAVASIARLYRRRLTGRHKPRA